MPYKDPEVRKRYEEKNRERISIRRKTRYRNLIKDNPNYLKELYQKSKEAGRVRLPSYYILLETQGNTCAICFNTEKYKSINGKIKGLAQDHDHLTGLNRGLLCSDCNLGLGHFRDNPEILLKAMEYLKKWQT